MEANPSGFGFGEFFNRVERLVSTISAHFESAKWDRHITFVVVVDPNRAGLQSFCYAMNTVDIAAPKCST